MFNSNGFSQITINGETIRCSGSNITIRDGAIVIDGKEVSIYDRVAPVQLQVVIDGNVNQIHCTGSVEVRGNSGSIDCGGSCSVGGDVTGDIDAGGSVTCGNVTGNIDAGGSSVVIG